MPTQQESNSSILSELYSYNPSALIELYELDLTPLQEYYTSKGAPIATTNYYFHNGYNERFGTIDAEVKWGAPEETYLARPIQMEGIQASSAGEVARPTLTIGNNDLFFTQLCKAYANLVGARVRRTRTFVKFLNSSNFETRNILLNTEAFNSWTVLANTAVTANATTAPNGTLTADKLYESTITSSAHGVQQTISTSYSGNICISIHLKASERINATLLFLNKANTQNGKTFNLQTGVVNPLTRGTVLNSGIQNVGNGWYRCWIVVPISTGVTTPSIAIYTDNDENPNAATFVGTVNSGIFVWGAQAEIVTNLTPTLYQAVGATAGNPTADPNAKFPDDVYVVDRMSEEVPGQITFELAPAWDVEGIMLPRRQIIANICPWTYKKDPCNWTVNGAVTVNTFTGTAAAAGTYTAVSTTGGTGTGAKLTVTTSAAGTYSTVATITVANPGTGYTVGNTLTVLGSALGGVDGTNNLTVNIATLTGAKYYDTDDQEVATAAQDQCGKRLTSCKLRFGTRVLPFGGFPSAGLYGRPI